MSDKRWANIWKSTRGTWSSAMLTGEQKISKYFKYLEYFKYFNKEGPDVDWWAKDFKKMKSTQKVEIWHLTSNVTGKFHKHFFNRCNFFTFDPEQSLLHAAQHREDEKNRCHMFHWKKRCHLLNAERQCQHAGWSIQLALPLFTVETGKRIGTNQKLC